MAGKKPKTPLKGVLHFHSETGTEGGYWAFQDERFISFMPADYGVWGNHTVWDQTRPERKGRTQEGAEVLRDGEWLPLPDPMQEEPDYFVSSLFRGEGRGDLEADKRLMEKYGFKIQYAADRMDERYGQGNWRLEDSTTAITSDGTRVHYGGTPTTEPDRPYGLSPGDLTCVTVNWEDDTIEQRFSDSLLVTRWSYEGLHYLKNGDHLIIYEKDEPTKVRWEGVVRFKQHERFTETVHNMWIHADMKGWNREEWAKFFFEGYPAKLVPS